jgi:hypothetical protein
MLSSLEDGFSSISCRVTGASAYAIEESPGS